MLFGCFLSAANSAFAKAMLLAFPVAEVLLFRNFGALLFGSPFVRLAAFRTVPRPRLQVLRFLLCAFEAPMYFFAIGHLPLVDVMTFYLAGPIYVTAISATILRERVGWRRWSAVCVGFAGVLIALRPSAALLSWPALVALTGSLLYAGMLTTTRVLRGTSDIVLLGTQIFAVFLLAAFAAPWHWLTPAPGDVILMFFLGIGTLITSGCINRALKLAPASIVVPYQYTLIVGAALFGYLFFNEKPEPTTLVGAAIIIAAGIYIFMRERKVAPKVPVVEAP